MTGLLAAQAHAAAMEVAEVFSRMPQDTSDSLVEAIASARRIALYGVGREGLQMKGLAMRLFHLGLDAHVVGDMTTPPVGAGDLLIVSAGPGGFATVDGLIGVGRDAGARTLVVTAQPSGSAALMADIVVTLPAQTMADDWSAKAAILPMGSLFETAQMVFFELVVIRLRERLGQTQDTMRVRHTNLE